MLRAEQSALIQDANKQLLEIRQRELDFFVQSFGNFGTMSSLIAGFTLSALTLSVEDYAVSEFWRVTFWVSAAIAIASSLHCVLTTTFVNVFAPGLALRGPTGSMVRAVKGMNKEKYAIFVSFLISIIFFQILTLATSWIKMRQPAAIACTGILLVGGMLWYKYCLRIYNRFYFEEPDLDWNDNGTDTKSHVIKTEVETKGSSQYGFLKSFSSKEASKDPANAAPAHSNVATIEGYLNKLGSTSGWKRRYFVLKGSDLLYYKSREEYDIDPSKSIKNRPISLEGYEGVTTTSTRSPPPFSFQLQPVDEKDERRIWKFQCDTISELSFWVDGFTQATGKQFSEMA